jgi:hypothetical protein
MIDPMSDTKPAKKAAAKKPSTDWESIARALAVETGHSARTLEKQFGLPQK